MLHARWSVLLSQHCSHIRLLYPPSLYIRLRTCPSKLHTCTGPESPKSSFQIHTFTCFKGRNPRSLLSFSFAYSFFNFSCVFTLLALLSVHSTCGQTACHVFVGYLYQLGPGSLVLSLRGARWFGPKDSFIENGDLGDLGRKRCRCRNFAAIVRALAAKLGCLINKPFSLCLFVFFSPSPVFRDAS